VFNLYSGAAGVALFLAAVARVSDREVRALARGALQPLCELAQQHSAPPHELLETMHGFGGWSSAVYVLVRMGQLLNEPSLIDDAEQLAAWIAPDAITAAEKEDVLTGVAGTALSLLSLYSVQSTAYVLNILRQCGDRLARHAIREYNDESPTRRESPRPLTGFSHGAAGIAYALCRLSEAIGDPQYLEAAEYALAYEQRHFDPANGGWADFRTARGELHTTSAAPRQASWCHGAPGIALGRLGVLKACSSTALLAELEFGLQATGNAERPRVDNLCCGAMGQIDVLLEAARTLNRPELCVAAARRAATVLGAARDEAGFAFFNHLPRWAFHPGMFQGVAGIGYELLRLAAPDIVPSVLLLA
jgi:type 2 lantibiotic biosynthesis protein LanM